MELPLSYLTRPTTYDEVVANEMHQGMVFGHANDDWERLKAKMQPGDELWYFEPPSQCDMQFWGLALVRAGRVVSTVITAVT